MVVPVHSMAHQDQFVQHVGDNLTLDLAENEKNMLVVGNNCHIHVDSNMGSIKLVGNNSEINVASGSGRIVYVGNNGKIVVPIKCRKEDVVYIGSDGDVTYLNDDCTASSSSTQNAANREDTKEVKVMDLNDKSNIVIANCDSKCDRKPTRTIKLPVVFKFARRTRTKLSK